jgi:hypothetical protein
MEQYGNKSNFNMEGVLATNILNSVGPAWSTI